MDCSSITFGGSAVSSTSFTPVLTSSENLRISSFALSDRHRHDYGAVVRNDGQRIMPKTLARAGSGL